MKRTFDDFFKRNSELSFRRMKVIIKFELFKQFHPIKAVFVYGKFKRIANGLRQQMLDNYKQGYYI